MNQQISVLTGVKQWHYRTIKTIKSESRLSYLIALRSLFSRGLIFWLSSFVVFWGMVGTANAQTAPTPKSLVIDGGKPVTGDTTVDLSISAEKANQMFISGDVVDDASTFAWIGFAEKITVNVTATEGTKQIRVKFRNDALVESLELSESIILDFQGPVIQQVGVHDVLDAEDFDGLFRAGQRLQVVVTEAGGKNYFDGMVRIESITLGYDSGIQQLTPVGGEYRFLWITDGLDEGEYTISITLEEEDGRQVRSDVGVALDNTPPDAAILRINNDAAFTGSRAVTLDITFPSDVVDMFIDGDVIDGLRIREFISVRNQLLVTLTEPNGQKEIEVRARDAAGNESPGAFSRITLNQREPEFLEISASDADDLTDADGVYHAGQQIVIEVLVGDALEGLEAQVRIISPQSGYDSQDEAIEDAGGGIYRFVWDTTRLAEANDYQATLRFSDSVGNFSEDSSLVFTIDNTPPQNFSVSLAAEARTASSQVELNLPAEGATEMHISGDVVDDPNTFDWVAYISPVSLVLTSGDGDKLIVVAVRDLAGNESTTTEVNVFLDATPPLQPQLTPNQPLTNTTKLGLRLAAQGAEQMFIEGDVEPSDVTFQFIPFSDSIEVDLTPGDGTKAIIARFQDGLGNESTTQAQVSLDATPPAILSVRSRNLDDPTDADNHYLPGATVEVVVASSESGLSGRITIASNATGVTTGVRPLINTGGRAYTFSWETVDARLATPLPPAAYQVSVELIDAAANVTQNNDINIVLDNTPPAAGTLHINDDSPFTNSRLARLTLDFPSDAASVFIDGDVTDGLLVRQFVPVRSSLSVVLTESAGEKQIQMRLRDAAGNESPTTSSTINFRESPPEIVRLSTFASEDSTDADGVYRSGQQIVIEALVAEALEGLDGQVRIISAQSGYDSQDGAMTDGGGGLYRFVWDTTELAEANDYQVTLSLSDGVGHSIEDTSLNFSLDNAPPQHLGLSVVGGARTAASRVVLNLPADGASEMRITGDLVNNANTFDWIRYTNPIALDLLPGDGEKRIEVTLRDRARNESALQQVTIFLDTTPPLQPRLTPNKTLTNTTNLTLDLAAQNAELIFIEGDIEPSDLTFQLIPFFDSSRAPTPGLRSGTISLEVELTPGDGDKTIIARFQDAVGNESQTQAQVTLDATPPEISLIQSRDFANPADADGRYQPGRTIDVIVTSPETGLAGRATISAEAEGVSTGEQLLTDAGDGTYTFIWNTFVLEGGVAATLPSAIYQVSVTLEDEAGNVAQDSNSVIILTTTALFNQVTINDEAESADTPRVLLQVTAPGALEMFIDGDVEAAENTLQFIPFASPIDLVLSSGDGLKTVLVQLRDAAGIDLGTATASIMLDQTPPEITSVRSQGAGEADTRTRYRAGERVNLTTTATRGETGLEATFRIRSLMTDYDSGEQRGQDNGGGRYTFLWDTVGLNDSDDYRVEAILTDGVGHTVLDDSTVISIDNISPQAASIEVHALNPSAEIHHGEDGDAPTRVRTRSIEITYSVEDATDLFVAGDLVSDSNTRVWIPVDDMPTWIGNLSPGDGPKTVQVRFRDDILNETEFVFETLILDEQLPEIVSVTLLDQGENRLITAMEETFFLRADQDVVVEVFTESELTVFVRMRSEAQGFDTGEQEATPVEGRNGVFQFLWQTQGLNDSDDYVITAIVQDDFDRRVEQDSAVVLDTVQPAVPTLRIDRASEFTTGVRVPLELSVEGATEMFISGDVVPDGQTFQWIPFREQIEINLTPDDDEKEVGVQFRDEARNETPIVFASITLNSVGPEAISIQVKDLTDFTSTRDIVLELEAERVAEMFIDGDVLRGDATHRWVPFASEVPVKLTTPDGLKQIGVRFRSVERNESARIQTIIVLDRELPEIAEILTADLSDPSDNDDIYHPGQRIQVSVGSEAGLTCILRITGPGFDSNDQEITASVGGVYAFTWDTTNLAAGRYSARWECTDTAGNQVESDLEIRLEDISPSDFEVTLFDLEAAGVGNPTLVSSPSVNLRLKARDAAEMFVSGDVIDDVNTFEWISFRESLIVNLAGRDGEKTISVRFRSAARNESQAIEAKTAIDLSRPRLVGPVRIFIDPDREGAIIVLSFDEDIPGIDPARFQLNLTNPFRSDDGVRFDGRNVASEINLGQVVLNLSGAQLQSILELAGQDPAQQIIRGSLAEGSVQDSAAKDNPAANDVQFQIQRVPPLPQLTIDNTAFSPNGDGVQETLRVSYEFPAAGTAIIEILDTNGEAIVTLRNEFQPAGFIDTVVWDGRDRDGTLLPEGVYQLKISVFDNTVGLPLGLETEEIILDNLAPEIVEVDPKDGQAVVGPVQFRVVTQDGGSVPSGVTNVFLDLVGQRIFLVSSQSEIFELPAGGQLNLPVGEQQAILNVQDGAGNATQQLLTYSVSSSLQFSLINFPNPMHSGGGTNLRYLLPVAVNEGSIRIFDAEGALVYFQELEELNAGTHPPIRWDGRDLFGNPLPRGVYFALLQVEVAGNTQKIRHKIAVR